MKSYKSYFLFLALGGMTIFAACGGDKSNATASSHSSGKDVSKLPLFEELDPAQTGLIFTNEVKESFEYNHIQQDVIFNGGGVALVDINNDGLLDVYLAGNMVSDKLFLNKGNMKFEDISDKAGITNDTWSYAVATADVNGDGWQDIYVTKYMYDPPSRRKNYLYINNHDLTFTESAEKYGVADMGHGTAANFFDYNNDGWLDLYVGNQPFVEREKKYQTHPEYNKELATDRLFRNNGNGTFTDVTEEAGLKSFHFVLSATAADIDNNGYTDLYVTCDYEEPDCLYMNKGDGTFVNTIHSAMRHISNFAMGSDCADFNNDGWIDIYTADMVASDNYRLKANMSGMNPERFWMLANNGYHYQYMFNDLHMNNGNGTFSEIGQLAGVSNTDWSWSTLFADFDQDGYKDLYVTNGLVQDVRNKDYIIKRNAYMDSIATAAKAQGKKAQIDPLVVAKMAPSVPLQNYMFHNKGDWTFEDVATAWGFTMKGWSYGAAYGDLDNDGDRDIVVNNVNAPALLYENKANELTDNHYIRIVLKNKTTGNNWNSVGARAWVFTGDNMQVAEVYGTRGYASSSELTLHFGLGPHKKIDRIFVVWPDQKQLELFDVDADQTLTLHYEDAQYLNKTAFDLHPPLFESLTKASGIRYRHKENEFDDYAREVLLPYQLSRLGPCIAVGDVDGDGLDDFYIGGAANQTGEIYIQRPTGTFSKLLPVRWAADSVYEDLGATFFDADGDGDLDLYVVSGGNEFPAHSESYQDRLYINEDGHGQFIRHADALPKITASGGCVAAADFDKDGDLDLFVGGRQIPGKYGYPANSYLLQNDGSGKFTDITATAAPDFQQLGMVTDAKWMDIDSDKDADLVIVGEWMPITVFENNKGKFENVTENMGLENTSGWWNRLALTDWDGDGDLDLFAGNLGTNIKYKASEDKPFRLFVKDFDNNGTNDVYLGYYDSDGVCYPVRGRQCSSQQMPFIKKEFKTYNDFAKASIDEVLGERKEGAIIQEAKLFESCWIENKGRGQFAVHKLPIQAQTSPVNGIACTDINGDGFTDVLLVGNLYVREVETTRSDAGVGCVFLGDGKGGFKWVHPAETGMYAIYDTRSLGLLNNPQKTATFILGNNNMGLQVYRAKPSPAYGSAGF